MSRRHLLAAAVAATLIAPVAAYAGGYVAIGAGGEAELHGDLAEHFTTAGTSAGRIAVGQRTGPLALEAVFFGTDLDATSGAMSAGRHSTLSLGVDLKYYASIAGNLEGYLRGGLNKTWVVAGEMDTGYEGRGYAVGGGLQYSFRLLPLVDAALWADYNHQVMQLHNDGNPSLEGGAGMLTLGVSVGTSL